MFFTSRAGLSILYCSRVMRNLSPFLLKIVKPLSLIVKVDGNDNVSMYVIEIIMCFI